MGKVIAVCISEKRGFQKTNVHTARLVEDWGIEGDAHAGKWHRQVSLLSYEKIREFNDRGADVSDGAFGENLVISGLDPAALPVGTRFRCKGNPTRHSFPLSRRGSPHLYRVRRNRNSANRKNRSYTRRTGCSESDLYRTGEQRNKMRGLRGNP